ncbi:MAG: type IV pilin protein, partial [Gammaproteobacteria bacterium]
MRSAQGFTLLEMLIVLVIVAITAAFAYPSYQQQVMESRRADAHRLLTDLANRQERYFTTRLSYAATLGQLGPVNAGTDGYYTVSLANPGSVGCGGTAASRCADFVLTARPAAGSPQGRD